MFVDLHTHTYYSDGIFSPNEVVKNAQSHNLHIFAIADHDTVDGIFELDDYSGSLKIIKALEITTDLIDIAPDDISVSLHILGYGIDPYNEALIRYLNSVQKRKTEFINRFLCASSSVFGSDVADTVPILHGKMLQYSDLIAYTQKHTPLQRLSDAKKLLADFANKWNNIFGSVQDAIDVIHQAGGIAILAHPFITYRNSERVDLTQEQIVKLLPKLIVFRLDGIETYYLSFSATQIHFLEQCAVRNNLLQSVGSDYHGYVGRTTFHHMDTDMISPLLQNLLS